MNSKAVPIEPTSASRQVILVAGTYLNSTAQHAHNHEREYGLDGLEDEARHRHELAKDATHVTNATILAKMPEAGFWGIPATLITNWLRYLRSVNVSCVHSSVPSDQKFRNRIYLVIVHSD